MMATPTAASSEDPWSIAIKPVGGSERNFTVSVSPEDALASLHDQIEGETGLKASQQRLIYRGRLIGKSDQVDDISGDSQDEVVKGTKIKDIVGLCDGQTIHLVEKKETETPRSNGSNADDIIDATSERVLASGPNDQSILTSADGESGSLSGGNGSASLLAALLGLGGLDDNDSNAERDAASASRQRWGWRSSRLGRRRPHYRLTAEDLEVPDPGSMEPVRQGLLTLHTMLPHAHVTQEQTEREVSPLEACRQFYRGQWIDCLDTVNAWLEATVVEVVKPDEILPARDIAVERNVNRRRRPQTTSDPAVSANDLDGRRRLLLESCDDDDGEMEEGELAGSRRRSNNDGVSLLLIHYNGWPHRWDEWIRSDSERIRPFRTRTRHPTMSSTVSPTPQSVFNEAPRTNFRDGSEEADREALLSELSRVISGVNQLILSAFQGSPPDLGEASVQGDLPWVQEEAGGERTSLTSPDLSPENGNVEQPVDDESQEPELALARASPFDSNLATCQRELNRRQLEMLAPILDRLGRALTDAAPHIASLAASLPEAEPVQNADNSSDVPDLVGDHHPPLGGLLSLLTRERNRRAQQSADQSPTSALDVEATRVSTIDPDHVDFASGLINTTRGEVRSGPRGRSQQDDMAGLLGAYLAAASLGSMTSGDPDNLDENGNSVQGLGRLLRDRGTAGGGGGIDIHIHAVVTAPGVTPGGLGFATLGGGGIVPGAAGMGTRNMFSSARERSRGTGSLLRSRHPTFASAIVNQDDDDWGLFSELYSENPVPVDPNGSPQPGERPERNAAGTDDSMQDDSDYLSRISSPRLGSGLAMRSDSLSLTTTRRSRRSNGSLARESSERSRGWGRLFRRRSRSSHRNGNGNQDST